MNGPAFEIGHLVDAPKATRVLARWFVAEWEPYYGPDGPGDAEADLAIATSRDKLPVCLVAVDEEGAPLGTVALKTESLPSHRHLSPWIVAFLVAPEHRGRGLGTALLAAVEEEAHRLGFERIYVATDVMLDLLARRGWRLIDQAPTLRGTVGVYSLALPPAATAPSRRRQALVNEFVADPTASMQEEES